MYTRAELIKRQMDNYIKRAAEVGYEVMGITYAQGLITLVDPELFVLEVQFNDQGRLHSEAFLTNHGISELA